MNQPWLQNFDPLGNTLLSTIAAAIPVCTLFFFLAVRRAPAWRAAFFSVLGCAAVAPGGFSVASGLVGGAVGRGLVFAGVRIFWAVVAQVVVFDLVLVFGALSGV